MIRTKHAKNGQGKTILARAPAKLNLCLEVLGKRSDGYHELSTLMVPLSLHDTLAVSPVLQTGTKPAPISLELRSHSASENTSDIPSGPENLVWKAAELLRTKAGVGHGVHIELTKRIPAQAGLGGGSSDAATALMAANAAWGLNWNHEQLRPIAAELGSDIPFFLEQTTAICRGRGEHTQPVRHTSRLHFVIVKPPGGLATSEVFESLGLATSTSDNEPVADGLSSSVIDISTALQTGRLAALGQLFVNHLQNTSCLLNKAIATIRAVFSRLDCLGHTMAGSGSSYFGLCRNAFHARRIAAILRTQQLGEVWVTHTC